MTMGTWVTIHDGSMLCIFTQGEGDSGDLRVPESIQGTLMYIFFHEKIYYMSIIFWAKNCENREGW